MNRMRGVRELTFEFTEELESERGIATLDYDVLGSVEEGEPCAIYSDGSGYPGSPPCAEVYEAVCTAVHFQREGESTKRLLLSEAKAKALGEALLRRAKKQPLLMEQLEDACFEECERLGGV